VLRDGDFKARFTAAFALGKIGDERAVEPLIATLADKNYHVRIQALGALGEIGGERAIEGLATALEDEELIVRHCATVALGRTGDVRAIEPLKKALKIETNMKRKVQLSRALIRLSQRLFLVLSKDKDPSMRERAAYGIGEIGNISGLVLQDGKKYYPKKHLRNNLEKALKTETDEKVKKAIQDALSKLENPEEK